MADVKVNFDLLARCAGKFAAIEQALDDSERSIQLHGASGSSLIEEALHDFANDWDIERERLQWKTKDLADGLKKAAEQYSSLECHLVESMTDKGDH